LSHIVLPRVSLELSCFADSSTTAISTLSLHDALPISRFGRQSAGLVPVVVRVRERRAVAVALGLLDLVPCSFQARIAGHDEAPRSEEHTSELQSRENLVCRLLLEKKKKTEEQIKV